jgi:GntR family transcriptional regulator/MocR family aminotransferase
LARAWRRVVKRRGRRLLESGHPAGEPGLRRALAEMVASVRGVPAQPNNVLVTRGSQMALDLCARTLLRPGDVVAVERLGYRPAWEALRLAGATLAPVHVDSQGLDVDAIERLAATRRLRAVYTTPHHQYPTTVTLAPARRLRLLALARRYRFAILEDDYDHEFHYEGRPVLPLASADDGGVVVYLGTLSKVLAPGLRLGFIVAPTAFIERATALRAVMDRQGDHPMEAAVAELLDEGELQRHVRKMRVEYLARRDALVAALRAKLGASFDFDVPRGGISVWLRPRRAAGFEAWRRRCAEGGVRLAPGTQYTLEGPVPIAARVVFSRYTAVELRRAVEALAPVGRG